MGQGRQGSWGQSKRGRGQEPGAGSHVPSGSQTLFPCRGVGRLEPAEGGCSSGGILPPTGVCSTMWQEGRHTTPGQAQQQGDSLGGHNGGRWHGARQAETGIVKASNGTRCINNGVVLGQVSSLLTTWETVLAEP